MKKSTLKRMLDLSDIKPFNLDNKLVTSTFELIKEGGDGNTYVIVRENKKYYIKSSETKENINESDFDYLHGLANKMKSSYPSFEKATKQLNLLFEGINRDFDSEDVNVLENDGILSEKKFVLKLNKKKQPKKEPVPQEDEEIDGFDFSSDEGEEDFDFDSEEGGNTEGEEDFDFDSEEGGETEGEEDFDFDSEEGGETEDVEEFDVEGDEEMVIDDSDDDIQDIQSTTGKLGQQLRDTEDITSDMQKWVAKSVLSALDLENMDSEDKNDIIKTLKKKPKEETEETEDVEEFDFEEETVEESYDSYMGDDDMEGMGNYDWGGTLDDEFPSHSELEMRDIEMPIVDKGYLNLDMTNDDNPYDSYMSEKSLNDVDSFITRMNSLGVGVENSTESYDSYMGDVAVSDANSGEYPIGRAAWESEDKEYSEDDDPNTPHDEDKLLLDDDDIIDDYPYNLPNDEAEALYGPNTYNKNYSREPSYRARKQADKDVGSHYHRQARPGYESDPSEKWSKHKLPYDTEFMGEGDYMTEDHLNDKMETYEQEQAYEDVETVVRRYGMDVELREKATSEDPEESLIYLDIVDGDTKLLVTRINSVGDIEVGEMRGNKFTGEPLDSVEDFIEIFGEDLTKKEKQELDMEESIEMSPQPQRTPDKQPNQPDTKPGKPERRSPSERPSRRPFTPPPDITPGEEPGPKAADGQEKVDKDTRYDKDNEKWSWEKDDNDIEFE